MTEHTDADPIDVLLRLDAELQAEGRVVLTLDPDRARARLPSELGAHLLPDLPDRALAIAFGEGLTELVRAIVRAFPGNLCWDLEYLSASVLRFARTQLDPPAALSAALGRITALQPRFGTGTEIRFRYVHDFIYGYDWARWVARAPAERSAIGPFDPPFIERMHRRADELLDIIAQGQSQRYPPIAEGAARNPFRFSREPEDELCLHRHLARHGLLPVESWRFDAAPRWDRPYLRLRKEAAARLGLA